MILRGIGLSPAQELSFSSALQCAERFVDPYPVLGVSQVLSSCGGWEKLLCEAIYLLKNTFVRREPAAAIKIG